jgi:hypothetical protein
MRQAEHDRVPRHAALQADTRRGEPHQAGPHAPSQRPVGGVCRRHVAGRGRPHGFPRAEGMLPPPAPAPGPDQAWRRPRRRPAQPVAARFPRWVDADEGDASIGGTPGRDPGIAKPRCLWAVPPGPGGQGHAGFPGDPTPSGPRDDRPPRALHDQGPLPVRLDVSHHGRIPPQRPATTTGAGRRPAPPRPEGSRPLQPDLQPRPLVAAGSARTHRVRAVPRNVDRDDQCPVPQHHPQPEAIDPPPAAMLRAALPGAHPPHRRARRLEHAVVAHPTATVPACGGWALVLDLRPPPDHEVLAPTLPQPEPRLRGQCPQDAAGEVLVPDPQWGQLVGRPPPTQGGAHQPNDGSQLTCPGNPHSPSAPRGSGRPTSTSACSRACKTRGARVCSCWRRSRSCRR